MRLPPRLRVVGWAVFPLCHTFSFSPHTGIECPRGARNLPGLVQEGEPFSEEATLFTKELVLQREVGHFHVASFSPDLTISCHVDDKPVAFSIAQPCHPEAFSASAHILSP